MTNLRFPFLAALFLFLVNVAAVHAGDYAKLNFIGFSKDGSFLAYEEHGVQDGSGFPYSNIYIVNVANNSFAAGPFGSRLENELATARQARTRSRLAAAAAMRKFGIVEGNRGTLVVSRLFTDLSVSRDPALTESKSKKINFAELVDSMYTEGDYDLLLDLREVKTKACEYEELPVYQLTLTLKDKKAETTTVLQKDSTLPPSRGCPINYGMQYVYLYKNNIAIFLDYYTTGFEGPDMRYLVATGKYKPF
jgi:predicted secreted protein